VLKSPPQAGGVERWQIRRLPRKEAEGNGEAEHGERPFLERRLQVRFGF